LTAAAQRLVRRHEMEIRPIRNDVDHEAALREIERLWNASAGSPEGDKLEVLATLVDTYESARWPAGDSDPVALLHYLIDEAGRTQQELADIIGPRPRASEILARKRALTIEMIDKISKAWSVPRGVLAAPYDVMKTRRPKKRALTKRPARRRVQRAV
jgi:HTH-type transcriptional regulator/antitoxin HigA